MGQKFFEDSMGTLTHNSGNLTLSESRVTLGGQQEYFTSLSYTVSSLSASTKYNLFLVKSEGILSLVPSTNSVSVGPVGYAVFKYVRSFVTNASSAFGSFSGLIADPNPVGTIIQSMLSLAQFQNLYGTGWILADGTSVSYTGTASTVAEFTSNNNCTFRSFSFATSAAARIAHHWTADAELGVV